MFVEVFHGSRDVVSHVIVLRIEIIGCSMNNYEIQVVLESCYVSVVDGIG